MARSELPLRIERLDPAMVDRYRQMSVTERIGAAFSLTQFVRVRLESHLRGTHPEWTEREVQTEVSRRLLYDAG